jgi:hypothetical protein
VDLYAQIVYAEIMIKINWHQHQSFRAAAACLVAIACLTALGCRKSSVRDREPSNLKWLATYYGQFQGRHRGQPPANEAELKDFIRSSLSETGAAPTPKELDALFISERSGKPYVILYGKSVSNIMAAGMPAIGYEREGKNGKRWAANCLGMVEELDESRFRDVKP